ncbi:MAG TPA: tetratricopeptide repeat protein [Longimicrobiales bacterium]|nr:tetratricopeptide repeat protein [Longimicrobiales bacterium]
MKIRNGLALSLAVAFGLSGCASGGGPSGDTGAVSPGVASVPGAQTLQQGERPRENEETRAAERFLEQAGEAADEAEARSLYEQALMSARAAIAADSTNPLPHLQAGLASLGMEDYPQADMHLDEAERLRPIYALETEGLRERAWLDLYQEAAPLVNQQQYAEAAEIFENANAIYDKRPEVMITLGQIYAQLREHDKAIENFDRALEIVNSPEAAEMDPEIVASWQEAVADVPLTRASVLADAGRFEEAAAAFRELSAADPTNVALARNLAGILVQMGETEEAFQVYQDLMGRPELTSADLYNIGVGFYQGSDYEQAAQAFGMAAEKSPKDRDAIEMWARSLQIDSAYAEVPPAAERWIELDPNNQNALLILAQAVNQMGDGDRASQLVHQIEALEVTVNDLQLQRVAGGAVVSGSVSNKTLTPGTGVTLNFAFYDGSGAEIGTTAETVSVGEVDAPVAFEVTFQSPTPVGGYGYTLTTG